MLLIQMENLARILSLVHQAKKKKKNSKNVCKIIVTSAFFFFLNHICNKNNNWIDLCNPQNLVLNFLSRNINKNYFRCIGKQH